MRTKIFKFLFRAVLLFSVGVIFALVLNTLQIQQHLPSLQNKLASKGFNSPWWVPAICGMASAVVGLLYPCLDHKLGEPKAYSQEWSSVMRCVALFVGINQASTKIDFTSNLQLSASLAILSIGLWWHFDRTRRGFGMCVIIAILATLLTQLLVNHGICMYTEREFLYVRSWLPCVVFSGGITIGNIGRQLAVNDYMDSDDKRHQE